MVRAMWVMMWFVCVSNVVAAADNGGVVVGYLPDYRVETITEEQVRGVTHLVFFSIQPPADGILSDRPVAERTLRRLSALRQGIGCRLLLCVGGWERSAGFAELTADDSRRRQFVKALTGYCRRHKFDGIDYDWEHPADDQQTANYTRLLTETKTACAEFGLEVSLAQAAWQELPAEAYAAVDRVHLMAYDHDFPQATFRKAVSDVDRLLKRNCPAKKIAIGIPFYGRNAAGDAKIYAELTGAESATAVDPMSDNIDGYAFNGVRTVLEKLNFARQRQLAGIMIWELAQDSAHPSRSLLHALRENSAP